MSTEKLISLKECAERTGHKTETWRLWVKRGVIPSFKLGGSVRVSERDLEKFIEAGHIDVRANRCQSKIEMHAT
jgi:excisionase family DNA binding protein